MKLMNKIKTLEPKVLWKLKCKLGEGTLWVKEHSSIYFVDIKHLGVEGVLLGNLYASIIMFLSSCCLLLKRFSARKINFSIMNQIIQFGLPFLPAAIFGIIMEGADRFILKYMMGESAVGIYSAGF